MANEYIPFLSKIKEIVKHTETEYTFRMTYVGEVRPGQFFEVSIPKYGEAPISVSGIGEDYVGGTLVWPVPGRTSLTSLYGMRVHPITGAYKLHTGIDISAPLGTYFVAAANGVVSKATYNTAYGNMVIIDHGGGVQTLYAHGNSILVQVGDEVKAGTPVLEVGSTGYSTGPHAHFEIRINGQTVNPLDYYQNKNSITSSATKEDDENKTEITESN